MKKILILLAVASSLFLAGCDPKEPVQLIRTEYKVVDIPEKFKQMCPPVGRLPRFSTLTDKEVADLLVKLWGTSKNCREAILGIYEHNRVAKSGLENKPIY